MPSRERSRHVDGVILRHNRWGEADRLLTVFSKELGKIRVVAKGVRKTRSRKAGHLEPFMRSALLLAQGRDWWIVTQADTLQAFMSIREDLQKTAYAAYIVELLDRFTYEDGPNFPAYRLLVETLERLDAGENLFVVIHYYEIRLLDLMGYRPQLFNCVFCGDEIQAQNQYFSAMQGGVICPKCGHKGEDARRIGLQALKYLRHFQRSTYQQALAAEPDDYVKEEVESIMNWYLTFLLERDIKTQHFIKDVNQGYSGK
ncbi:MAG: DNA repair protein RecO [Anaerolineaceae bacterium]|nr:DNA repair protein RecO [Anaerolineaceae bacterium]